nr:hypothetical protein [Tanacetum cinerariifolium]
MHAIQVGCQNYGGAHAHLDTTQALTINHRSEKRGQAWRSLLTNTGGINTKKSRDGRMGKETPGECRD